MTGHWRLHLSLISSQLCAIYYIKKHRHACRSSYCTAGGPGHQLINLFMSAQAYRVRHHGELHGRISLLREEHLDATCALASASSSFSRENI